MDEAVPQVPAPEPFDVSPRPRKPRPKLARRGRKTLYERPTTSKRTGQPLALVQARRRLNELEGTGHASPAVRESQAELSRRAAADSALRHAIAESMGLFAQALIPPPDPRMTVTLHYDHVIGDARFPRGTYTVEEPVGRTLMEQESRLSRLYAAEGVERYRVVGLGGYQRDVGAEALNSPPPIMSISGGGL
ncbi:MAG: hypothetical protein EPN91_08025 [Salinibacterium sp.]|nr:MAG: hypothetical protein EPN91_08025 [Salinibacterium sp.]